MRNKFGTIIALLCLCFHPAARAADAVTFTAEAARSVIMGQYFNLVYSSNQELEDLRIPEVTDFFEILYGPSTAYSNSSSYANGKRTSVTTYSFTYVLRPKKTGTFTIPGATAIINGSKYKTNNLSINVLPSDQAQSGGGSSASGGSGSGSASASGSSSQASTQSVGNDQIFIRAIPSKTRVREQEGLLMTYKLYTRVDIAGYENPKFPEFKGFLAQEIELSQNQQWNLENYNGSNYQTAILKQTYLYPRESGTLSIDKGSFDITVRVKNRNTKVRSIFDDFFETYSEVKKTIYSNPIRIQVDPLPSGKPQDFCGIAGKLNMTSALTKSRVKANEAVTITLKISGSGNLKMIPTPELTFPADFEVYDPKVDNGFKTGTNGVNGTKTIEYLVIPRFPGTFEIPSVSLSYFDLSSKSYKTLTSQKFTLTVDKGDGSASTVSGNFTNQEQVRLLGSDIRYLKKNFKLEKADKLFFGTTLFWLAYLLPFLLFLAVLYLYRKQVKANADLARVRNRKASKVAVKRLKQAGVFLKEGKKEAFYDEVLRALWGYTSDKLNIPLSKLDKETIESQLMEYKVEESIQKQYMEILQTCEFARFAPGNDTQAMDKLYEQTMDVMNKMESTIKK